MRNHLVADFGALLNSDGSLREAGWSTKQVQRYERSKIKASALRIKEWDYYLVLNENFGAAFTVSDLGFGGLFSVSFLDFTKPAETTKTIIKPLTLGKTGMPASSAIGDVHFADKKLKIDFIKKPDTRQIRCTFKDFKDGSDFKCDITLNEPKMDSIVIATPWKEKKTAFYYNQKINCMPASGSITLGGKRYEFNPETDFGTLDWGRGVWTYDNTWYWGSGNGYVEGKPFGFNIGYGFGDTTAASENVIFYDGKAHKLDDVTFNIPESSYLDKWTFTSSDGRFETEFEPIIDRCAKIDAKVILSDQHQVFGKMSGKAVLDDGKVLNFKDMLVFAEKVHNKY